MADLELISAIKGIGTAFDEFKGANDGRLAKLEKRLDSITDRVESHEAANDPDRPRPIGADGAPRDFKQFETDHGRVFEIPSNVKMGSVPELAPAREPEISLERWLAATVAGERCGDRAALEFARERKQMLTTTTGVLIPAEYQTQWIDLLRARSVLNTAGMRTVNMLAKQQTHAAVVTDPAATWHSEAGSVGIDDPTFAARTLTAQTLVSRCQASVELAQDSPDFGVQIANVIAGAMAAEIDRVGLEGTGTPPEPRGIRNTSGRSSTTAVGTITDFSKVVTGLGALLSANCDLAQISKFAVMNPRTWAAFENLATGIASDKTQLPRPRSIQDMQFLVTSNVAGSAAVSPQVPAALYLGDFRDLLLGVRLEASIEVVKAASFASNLLLEIVGYARGDFLVTRPASFHTLEGILA